MTRQATIKLSNITKSFGETRALKGCDFEAYAGEVHAVVGENGSGKSTLAKIMSGVLSADGGSVDILGTTIAKPRDARRIGLATIFQEVLVADDATILENLYVGQDGLLFHGSNRATRETEAQDLLNRFTGSTIDLYGKVGNLTLSNKQWVVIARAILQRPKILILDESSAALDLDATQRLHTEIDSLRQKGITIILVTHRIAELVRIADRATILRDGKTVGQLGRGEITEAKLLEVMTSSNRKVSRASSPERKHSVNYGTALLNAKSIAVSLGKSKFDFDLRSGMIVGLAGLDGQGQDIFAKVLAGILPPLAGRIEIAAIDGTQHHLDGLDVAADQNITWVSGDRKREGILPQQSIFENFAIGVYRRSLRRFGIVDRKGAGQMFASEASRLSIRMGSLHNRITSLSGGNQQKVLIARAFANAPRIIVLNDPARGVDIGTKRDLYRELRAFAEAGGAVVYLSTEIEEFIGFADRVDVFFRGSLFRSLVGAQVNEDELLAAMFGQAEGKHIAIKFEEASK